MITAAIHPASPYKGLAPYAVEDAPFFFGREREAEIVRANLMASRLTVLYGPSGAGKSSLLYAGVARTVQQRAHRDVQRGARPEGAVVVFRSWRGDPARELAAAAADAVRDLTEDRPHFGDGLEQTLRAATTTLEAYVFIILDQFEEYFLYHPFEDSSDAFADEFPNTVAARDLPVNFLLSLREDSLAKLDRFKGRIPQLFDNRLRIDHLDVAAARQAIERPLEAYSVYAGDPATAPALVEPTLVEAVLDQLRRGRVGQAGPGFVDVTTGSCERVELPYLQLVMSRLWEQEAKLGSRVLRLETLTRLGGAETIARSNLDETMAALPPEQQRLAASIFRFLVTPSGAKIAHTAADLAEYAEVAEDQLLPILDYLAGEARILRPVAASHWEIFHDVLATAIVEWRNRHDQAAERREAEERLALQRRVAQRLRVLIALQALLLVALVAMTVVALR